VFQHELPSLKGSEEDCIADFMLRKDARISYPGACSLEFQSVMQILTECLLRWDTKTQTAKGKGILGTVVAFAGADEEQGRKTLHRHWQIWVKEINQTVRDSLFHKDTKTRTDARNTFLKHIDRGSSRRVPRNFFSLPKIPTKNPARETEKKPLTTD